MNTIKLALLIVVLFFYGCSSINYPKVHGQNFQGNSLSSYVRWNDNYIVTVKHAGILDGSSYISEEYDLQFVKKHSVNEDNAIWAYPVNKEKLLMFGYVKNRTKVYREGYDAGVVIKNLSVDAKYRLIDRAIKKGMSGGPVFNSKNEVVGINIGYTSKKIDIDGNYSFYSIYLPYDVIEYEWIKSGLN